MALGANMSLTLPPTRWDALLGTFGTLAQSCEIICQVYTERGRHRLLCLAQSFPVQAHLLWVRHHVWHPGCQDECLNHLLISVWNWDALRRLDKTGRKPTGIPMSISYGVGAGDVFAQSCMMSVRKNQAGDRIGEGTAWWRDSAGRMLRGQARARAGWPREPAEKLCSLERNCKSPKSLVRMFCLGRSSNGRMGVWLDDCTFMRNVFYLKSTDWRGEPFLQNTLTATTRLGSIK